MAMSHEAGGFMNHAVCPTNICTQKPFIICPKHICISECLSVFGPYKRFSPEFTGYHANRSCNKPLQFKQFKSFVNKYNYFKTDTSNFDRPIPLNKLKNGIKAL